MTSIHSHDIFFYFFFIFFFFFGFILVEYQTGLWEKIFSHWRLEPGYSYGCFKWVATAYVFRGLVKEEYLVIIVGSFFLFLHKNICCGYSLEAPRWGASNEYPQHMFLWRTRENYPIIIIKYSSLTSPLCFPWEIRIKALKALVGRLSLSVGW